MEAPVQSPADRGLPMRGAGPRCHRGNSAPGAALIRCRKGPSIPLRPLDGRPRVALKAEAFLCAAQAVLPYRKLSVGNGVNPMSKGPLASELPMTLRRGPGPPSPQALTGAFLCAGAQSMRGRRRCVGLSARARDAWEMTSHSRKCRRQITIQNDYSDADNAAE
jgi:hypothetical protein